MDTQPTRRRSTSVSLGVAAVLVATLSGCSASADEEDYEYGAICVDQDTQQRVNDEDDCDEGPTYGWYFIPVGAIAPAIGERAGDGSFGSPSSGEPVCYGGVPREGGEVTQGGFGACSSAVGG